MPSTQFIKPRPRRLQFKRLGILLIIMIVLGGGAYELHAFQVKRNSHDLLERAHHAVAAKNTKEALDAFNRYLRLEPFDNDAVGDFGMLLAQVARETGSASTRRQAYFNLERAVRNDRDRNDWRLELVRVAMALGVARVKDARVHLKVLLNVPNDDPFTWSQDIAVEPEPTKLLGLCFETDKDYEKAVECYQRAIKAEPKQIDCYVRAATILRRRLHKDALAEILINDADKGLLAKNPRSAAACVAHAQYSRAFGKPDEAAQDLENARSLAPTDISVILESAEQAVEDKKLDDARRFLVDGVEANPESTALYLALERVDLLAGKIDNAKADLERGLEKLPNNADLQWSYIDIEVDLGELADAADRIKRLRRRGYNEDLLRFEEARIDLRTGKFVRGASLFEKVAPDFSQFGLGKELARRTVLERGECYLRLGKIDRRLELFQKWLENDERFRPARIGLAETQVMLGKLDDAIATYQVLRLRDKDPELGIAVARLQIIVNLRRPEDQRKWAEIKALLNELSAKKPDSEDIVLLRAEILAAEDPKDGCRLAAELIEKALEKDPKQLRFLLAHSTIAERMGKPELALERLNEAEKLFGDRVEIRLARARWFSRRTKSHEHLRIIELAAGVDTFSKEDQATLLRGLGEALVAAGELEAARPIWRDLGKRLPDDLEVKLVQFDLARFAGDEGTMDRMLSELKVMEGADGSHWRYCEVCSLMNMAMAGDSEARKRAWQLLADLKKQRKKWGRVFALEGELFDSENRPEMALARLREAYDLGERNPIATMRLLRLLTQMHKLDEAHRVIEGLPNQAALSSDMQRIIAAIDFRAQDFSNAYQIARRVIPADSKNYRDYLWLATLARQLAKKDEAKKDEARAALEKARTLAPQSPEVWLFSIDYFVAVGDKETAIKILNQAKEHLGRSSIALGACYELVGNDAAARAVYSKAVEDGADNPYTLSSVASFHLQHDEIDAAETLLKQVVELKGQSLLLGINAERLLLEIRARKGNPDDMGKLLADLDRLEASFPENVSLDEKAKNLRTKSLVLGAQKDPSKRREAIAILEKMHQDDTLTASDQYRLARLYESVEDWPQCRALLLQLLNTNRTGTVYLIDMAYRFLYHNEKAEAAACVSELEKQQSGPPSFAVTSLKALMLKLDGKTDDAVNTLKEFARTNKVDNRSMAAAMDQVEPAAAEEYYRKFVQESGKPESKLVLALYLGRRPGRINDALDICEACRQKCKHSEVDSTAVALILESRAEPSQAERVAKWLQEDMNADKANASLFRTQLANLRTIQGNYDQAITLYREMAKNSAPEADALNNLAWLLALRGSADDANEALNWLTLAEKSAGLSPSLLDNRALVNLKRGKPAEAIRDLKSAIAQTPKATYYLHLGQAYWAANQRNDAQIALYKAENDAGLTKESLHPLEVPGFELLKDNIDKWKAGGGTK